MFDRVVKLLENAVATCVFPGCTVGVAMKDHCWHGACGRYTYDQNAPQVNGSTVYDVASITKAVPVSCCALKLIENGHLSENDRLIDYIPEFSGRYRELIKIRHLLTHTVDFGYRLSSVKGWGGDAIMDRILSSPLLGEPGMVFSYANVTSILLGLVIERVTGFTLDKIAEYFFFKPLSMRSTTFHPEILDRSIIAPSENDAWRGRVVCAEVHDESAFALRPKVVGSAGLFSTASDLLRFTKLLLQEGSIEGKSFFNKQTVTKMYTNMLPVLWGTTTGLGWELDQPYMGTLRSRQTFGKTGFTGCSIVIDPCRKTGIVLLSNHIFPQRRNDRLTINSLRADLADLVFKIADTIQ